MPYIITTKRRNGESAECGGCGERQDDGSVCEAGGWLVSRRAVATLEESSRDHHFGRQPDGSETEVHQVAWAYLAEATGLLDGEDHPAGVILAAYNGVSPRKEQT